MEKDKTKILTEKLKKLKDKTDDEKLKLSIDDKVKNVNKPLWK